MKKIGATIATVAAMAAITAGSAFAASHMDFDSALPPGMRFVLPLRQKSAPAPVAKHVPVAKHAPSAASIAAARKMVQIGMVRAQ